jgi:hypothetical protein
MSREVTDFIRTLHPASDDWTCCGNHAGDLDSQPEAAKVEAVIVLGSLMLDAGDRAVMYRMPPALAVAIVNAFESGDPVTYARSRAADYAKSRAKKFATGPLKETA